MYVNHARMLSILILYLVYSLFRNFRDTLPLSRETIADFHPMYRVQPYARRHDCAKVDT